MIIEKQLGCPKCKGLNLDSNYDNTGKCLDCGFEGKAIDFLLDPDKE